jgi:hypothetical protein
VGLHPDSTRDGHAPGMRVLFTTSEWPTHYFPMVPLGWALQAAGHEVRVACMPSQTDFVARAGLVPLPVMDGPDLMFKTRLARYRAAFGSGEVAPGSVLHPVTGQPLARLADFDLAGYTAQFKERNLRMMRDSCDRVVDFARRWSPDLVVSDPQNVEGYWPRRCSGYRRCATCSARWAPTRPSQGWTSCWRTTAPRLPATPYRR